MKNKKVVFISGSGHSGSTLLDMCLGGHSEISALGETGFLYLYANNYSDKDLCTCGQTVEKCPFWREVAIQLSCQTTSPQKTALKNLVLSDPEQVLLDDKGQYRDRMPNEKIKNRNLLRQVLIVLGSETILSLSGKISKQTALHHKIAQNRQKLYQAVFDAHNSSIIVDSSKTPGVLKETWMTREFPTLYIRLLRDGRAVCASRMRRLGVPMKQAANFWRREHLKERAACLTVPNSAIRTVYYEKFVEDPQAFLEDLCEGLDIKFEKNMLDFRSERHNIGGNPMRFRDEETVIKPDSRWKSYLTADDLVVFDKIAGSLNKSLGYTDDISPDELSA